MGKTTLEEISAGGVVYRKNDGKFLIGKHSGYHKWVLPKGLVECGESQTEAAVREVEEEVGVEAKIVDLTPLKTIEYYYFADLDTGGATTRRVKNYQENPAFAKASAGKARIHKQVIFYLMKMQKDLGKEGWEMEERKWVSYEEGMKLLAFPTERGVFGEAGKILKCL